MDADIDLGAAGSDFDSDATSTNGFDIDAADDGSHLGGADPGPSTSAVVANLDAGDDTLRDSDLLNRLFGCRSKKTSKLRVTGLCAGNSPVNSPHKWPVTRKMFPFDDVIMTML